MSSGVSLGSPRKSIVPPPPIGSPRLARGSIATKDAGGARLSAIGRMALRDKPSQQQHSAALYGGGRLWPRYAEQVCERPPLAPRKDGSHKLASARGLAHPGNLSLQPTAECPRHPGRHDALDVGTQVPRPGTARRFAAQRRAGNSPRSQRPWSATEGSFIPRLLGLRRACRWRGRNGGANARLEEASEAVPAKGIPPMQSRAAIARTILGPGGATALQEDLGYKRTEIHVPPGHSLAQTVENLLQGLAQASPDGLHRKPSVQGSLQRDYSVPTMVDEVVLYSEPEDDDERPGLGSVQPRGRAEVMQQWLRPDSIQAARCRGERREERRSEAPRQKPLALRGAAQAPEAAAELDWGSLSDNSRQAIKQWVTGQLGGRHCMLVLEQGCAETLLLPSASETLATSDLRGGAVLNVLSGLFAEGGLLNPSSGSGLFQAVFSKHPLQVLEEALEQCLLEISDPRVERVADLSPDQVNLALKQMSMKAQFASCTAPGADAAALSASSDECTKATKSEAAAAPACGRARALAVLHEALSAQAPAAGTGHPWVCEFLAWQLEDALSEDGILGTSRRRRRWRNGRHPRIRRTWPHAERQRHRLARAAQLPCPPPTSASGPPAGGAALPRVPPSWRLQGSLLGALGLRAQANRPLVAKLFEGKLSPQEFLSAEEGGALLPAEMRERRRQLEDSGGSWEARAARQLSGWQGRNSQEEAAERAAAEARAVRAASALPFFSEKIQCQGCSNWGVRYDRIPHVGGHHKLGKTAGLGGTDYARLVVWTELARLHVEGWPSPAHAGPVPAPATSKERPAVAGPKPNSEKVFGDGGVLKELGKEEVELEAESQQMSLETLRAQNRLIEEYVMRLVRQRDELKQERDSYHILGLHGPSCSEDEVKKAYRNLARKEHPDKAGIGNKRRFQAIQQAYSSILKQRQLGGAATVAAEEENPPPEEVFGPSAILDESYRYAQEARASAECVARCGHRALRSWDEGAEGHGKRRVLRSLRDLTRFPAAPKGTSRAQVL
eukprot:s3673_g1.t3